MPGLFGDSRAGCGVLAVEGNAVEGAEACNKLQKPVIIKVQKPVR